MKVQQLFLLAGNRITNGIDKGSQNDLFAVCALQSTEEERLFTSLNMVLVEN